MSGTERPQRCVTLIRGASVFTVSALAQDEAFRSAIERDLRDLPDWQPVLYPEVEQPHLQRSTKKRASGESM